MKQNKKANETQKCKYCKSEVSNELNSCPICGKKIKRKHTLIKVFICIIVFCSFCTVITEIAGNTDIYEGQPWTNQDEKETVTNILSNCGIIDVKKIEHDDMLDNAHMEGETGYRLSCDIADNIILYMDESRNVYLIKYADHELYKDNYVVSKLTDYVITINEASEYQILCENYVKQVLLSPKSAEFPLLTNGWNMAKNDGIIIVQSYVDAENAYGAKIRTDFQFKIDIDDKTIISFIFDGQEMIQ